MTIHRYIFSLIKEKVNLCWFHLLSCEVFCFPFLYHVKLNTRLLAQSYHSFLSLQHHSSLIANFRSKMLWRLRGWGVLLTQLLQRIPNSQDALWST